MSVKCSINFFQKIFVYINRAIRNSPGTLECSDCGLSQMTAKAVKLSVIVI